MSKIYKVRMDLSLCLSKEVELDTELYRIWLVKGYV